MSRGKFEDRQNMTRPWDSYSSSGKKKKKISVRKKSLDNNLKWSELDERFRFCSESNKIHDYVFCSLKPPVGPHAFSVFVSLGFGLPRVSKAEVRQRVQNPPPGPPPDPGDGCRERAQGSDGRAHASDRGLAAEHLHAAGTQLAGQQHRRYSPQEEEGQSTHTRADSIANVTSLTRELNTQTQRGRESRSGCAVCAAAFPLWFFAK